MNKKLYTYRVAKANLDSPSTKHSFLRELREVAPEMELFWEYHSPYEKYFVTKLLYLQSFQLAILQNYLYLKEYDRKVARHIF